VRGRLAVCHGLSAPGVREGGRGPNLAGVDGVALASVIVSGVVGVSGLALAAGNARGQRKHEREWKMRDERRVAYSEFVAAVTLAEGAVRSLHAASKNPTPIAFESVKNVPERMIAAIHARWAAEIVAPAEVRAHIRAVDEELTDIVTTPDAPADTTRWEALLDAIRRDLDYLPSRPSTAGGQAHGRG
jgi:hypothetical protein